MNARQALECTECGEFSQTDRRGLLGPVCERCYQWELRAFGPLREATPEVHEMWREASGFVESRQIPVGQS